MGEPRPWADLHPDLIARVAGGRGLSLVDFTALRSLCSPWRSAVLPPTPLLIYTASDGGPGRDDAVSFAAAFSLPARRPLDVRARLGALLADGSSLCVGSGRGWLAVDELGHTPRRLMKHWWLVLMNPISGARIRLPPWMSQERTVTKVVFAPPDPGAAGFAAFAIYSYNWVAYARSGDKRWMEVEMDQESMHSLVDIVYHDDGKVYCLTSSGGVRVLHLRDGRRNQVAWFEPLLPEGEGSLPFDPETVFGLPCSSKRWKSLCQDCKHLVFCEGNLYQVWRNPISARTPAYLLDLLLDDDDEYEYEGKEVIVLKFDPAGWPCWREVEELGGYSVFIGKNNAVALRADGGVPWLRANCVYWIGGMERAEAIVFDMATQNTAPCVPDGDMEGYLQWARCWYFV